MTTQKITLDVNISDKTYEGKEPKTPNSSGKKRGRPEKPFWEKKQTYRKLKQASMLVVTTTAAVASKSAGYSGNYIQQHRINQAVATIGTIGALTYGIATGNVLAIGAGAIGIGMSIWDYKENITTQNLQASYQAKYKGARMNGGKL